VTHAATAPGPRIAAGYSSSPFEPVRPGPTGSSTSAAEQHVFTEHNTFRDASLALLGIAPPTLQL
jgi:hypothetical protein